jgi:hypothetical protein
MKLALIEPDADLGTGGSDTYMVLAHRLDERRNPGYVSFFKSKANMTSEHRPYIILDNGAHENPEPLSLMDTFKKGALIDRPDVVALPDVQLEPWETVRRVDNALWELLVNEELLDAYFKLCSPQLMIIPQGKSWKDWYTCLHRISELWINFRMKSGLNWKDPVLGISKKHEKVIPGGLISLVEASQLFEYDVHLLGWPRWNTVKYCAKYYDHVKSVDTAKPFIYTLAGQDISLTQAKDGVDVQHPRPEHYFHMEVKDLDLLNRNLASFRRACDGS